MNKNLEIKNLLFGTISTIESTSIPRGASSDSLNWRTLGDRASLRAGYKTFGNSVDGVGKITGNYTAEMPDGTKIQYKTHGKILEYYVVATDTWTEVLVGGVGNALGNEADGKMMSFAEWHPGTGNFLYINSPYGNFLKIDLSNPGVATNVYNGTNNFYGYIKIKYNRMFLWQATTDKATIDPSGVYLSKIDDPVDFRYSATRTAGEGAIFNQDDGGVIQSIESFGDVEYCFHEFKTWALTLSEDDTKATNLIYREKVGIPNKDASVATGDGIYYLDAINNADPQLRVLSLNNYAALFLPSSVSKGRRWNNIDVGLDLTPYLFDKCILKEFGDLILVACRTTNSTQNNRIILFNKRQRTFDITNYWASTLNIHSGYLMAGDPVSNNVFQLFSDYDDEGSNIENYWIGNKDDFGWYGEKKLKKITIRGYIAKDQKLNVYAKMDEGNFVLMGTISGNSSVVTSGIAIVGRTTIGTREIGGGGSGDVASEFVSEIKVNNLLSKFNFLTIKFMATELGTIEVSSYCFYDWRVKSGKLVITNRTV